MSSFFGFVLPEIALSLPFLPPAISDESCEEKARDAEEDISLPVVFFGFGAPYKRASLADMSNGALGEDLETARTQMIDWRCRALRSAMLVGYAGADRQGKTL